MTETSPPLSDTSVPSVPTPIPSPPPPPPKLILDRRFFIGLVIVIGDAIVFILRGMLRLLIIACDWALVIFLIKCVWRIVYFGMYGEATILMRQIPETWTPTVLFKFFMKEYTFDPTSPKYQWATPVLYQPMSLPVEIMSLVFSIFLVPMNLLLSFMHGFLWEFHRISTFTSTQAKAAPPPPSDLKHQLDNICLFRAKELGNFNINNDNTARASDLILMVYLAAGLFSITVAAILKVEKDRIRIRDLEIALAAATTKATATIPEEFVLIEEIEVVE